MEFVPFGQDGIPPTAGKTLKCRMLYNSLEFIFEKGIEAFNLISELHNLLTSYISFFFVFLRVNSWLIFLAAALGRTGYLYG